MTKRSSSNRIPQSRPLVDPGLILTQAAKRAAIGDAKSAIRLCQKVLVSWPDLFDAHHILGFCYSSLGDFEAALASYDRAAALAPPTAELWNNKGIAFLRMGAAPRAAECFDTALSLDPAYLDALVNRGAVALQCGRVDSALSDLTTAYRMRPRHKDTIKHYAAVLFARSQHNEAAAVLSQGILDHPRDADLQADLSICLHAQGQYDQALTAANAALTVNKNHKPALTSRAAIYLSRRQFAEALRDCDKVLRLDPHDSTAAIKSLTALDEMGRFDEALQRADSLIKSFPDDMTTLIPATTVVFKRGNAYEAISLLRKTIADYPTNAALWAQLGAALMEVRDYDGASEAFGQALEIAPDNLLIRNNLAVVALRRRQTSTGLRELYRALRRDPSNPEILSNIGFTYMKWGKLQKAEDFIRRSRSAQDTDADTIWNHALLRLMQGDFEAGWEWYEARRKRSMWRKWDLPGREASSETDLQGRLLLYAEQGLGDTIQFARYAQLLAQRALSVELAVQAPLLSLLGKLDGVKVTALGADSSDCDVHAPLMSLPYLLKTRAGSIPQGVPYVFAEEERITYWGEKIGSQGFRIGISWQGNPHSEVDEGRSFPVKLLAPIAMIPGVRLISLQKNAGTEQLADLPDGMSVETLGADFDATEQAFLDAAAVMANLDLIITSDTAIAHVAGAMGRPLWLALKYAPDWRWLMDRSDSPWYPTARLFRQVKPGDWGSVFSHMAVQLTREYGQRLSVAAREKVPTINSLDSDVDHERQAVAAMNAGDFLRALKICDECPQSIKTTGLFQYIMAFANASLGRHEQAIEHYFETLRTIPRADIYSNLAASCNAVRRFADALQAANEALAKDPGYTNAMINRAQALIGLERFAEAKTSARRVIELEPNFVAGWINLASALNGLKDYESALAAADHALKLDPSFTAASDNRAAALAGLGRHSDAIRAWDNILEQQPDNLVVLCSSVRSLIELGRTNEALARARKAAAGPQGKELDALTALAMALSADQEFEEATKVCEAGLALSPESWQLQSLLGSLLIRLHRFDEAMTVLKKVRDLMPTDEGVRRNLMHVALAKGDFTLGWNLFEERKRYIEIRSPRPIGPEARYFSELKHRRVFLYAEQGLGDTIQFARFAEMVATQAESVDLEVQAPLVALLSGLKGVRVIDRTVAPLPFDVHLPLMSVAPLAGTRLETIPASIPYVFPDPKRVSRWSDRLGSDGFRIGIAWQGNVNSPLDPGRSFPVRCFEGISNLRNVRLISLQKNAGSEQLDRLPAGMTVETLGSEFDAGPMAFLDTIAVIANLDLVITSDTAVAHVAGAMGRPVWIALQHVCDWRWMLERSDCPWYPTARLFRQERRGDWADVFNKIEAALKLELKASRYV